MNRKQAEIRINELVAILTEANRKYYVDNAPTLTDYEFDLLLKELEALEKEFPEFTRSDSPTRMVGSGLSSSYSGFERIKEFEQFPHRYPMLSLGNTYDISEVQAFADRAAKSIGHAFT